MNNKLKYANFETPKVKQSWIILSSMQRKKLIDNLLTIVNVDILKDLEIIDCKDDGQVIIRIKKIMTASERGSILLNLEHLLKNNIDDGINLWGESLGDKNSLRNLRGIEVK